MLQLIVDNVHHVIKLTSTRYTVVWGPSSALAYVAEYRPVHIIDLARIDYRPLKNSKCTCTVKLTEQTWQSTHARRLEHVCYKLRMREHWNTYIRASTIKEIDPIAIASMDREERLWRRWERDRQKRAQETAEEREARLSRSRGRERAIWVACIKLLWLAQARPTMLLITFP